MKVLVVGCGGREHALCCALARSPRLTQLFILPGNAGTEAVGTNVPGDPSDVQHVLGFATREQIDLTVVGPEEPLAAGIVDAFVAEGLKIFGPTAAAARLEADKGFAKQLMRQHAIPTAEARVFDRLGPAREYIATRDEPLVVKAAGLARGKGVIVCDDPADGLLAAERILEQRIFGDAGAGIVVEEKLLGREASVLAIVDGRTAYVLETAQDYKRLLDDDQGPNTGGMGSFSPASTIDASAMRVIETQILVPTLNALIAHEIHYRGVLYLGLMLTAGGPKLLEYNCRFGDPEAQVILPRIQSGLLETLDLTASGRLEDAQIRWDARHALCIVLASGGYPGPCETGKEITGLPDDDGRDDLFVFHAGTRRTNGKIVNSGGRVLGVTALGETLADARDKAYEALGSIRFEGAVHRTDLGR